MITEEWYLTNKSNLSNQLASCTSWMDRKKILEVLESIEFIWFTQKHNPKGIKVISTKGDGRRSKIKRE